MRILITNDDGYQAKGIKALVEIMKEFGEASAPEQEDLGDTQDLLDVISEIDGKQPQAVQPESEVKAEAEVIPTSNAKVTLADLSQEALAVAKQNIVLHHLTGRVSCVKADALAQPAILMRLAHILHSLLRTK